MKKLIARIWLLISRTFKKLTGEVQEIFPVVIGVIEKIKKAVDDPLYGSGVDLLERLISHAPPVLRDKLRTLLPEVLDGMTTTQSVLQLPDNIRWTTILSLYRNVDPEYRKAYWHGLMALIAEKLSDGEINWSDSIAIGEYVKTHEKPAPID